MEGRARRALLRHDIERLPPEVQQRFRRRAGGWAGGNGRIPLPEQGLSRRLAEGFVRAAGALKWLKERVIERGVRMPPVLDAQLRLGGERGASCGALVDIPRREVRICRLSTGTIALPLTRAP
jgi:hypothetical protein